MTPVFLDLLGAPAGVGLPHVGRRLDGGDELEDDVAHADEPHDGASNDAQHAVVQQDGAHEDVEGAAPDEGEEEGGVARDLRRDLELEKAGGYRPGGGRLSVRGRPMREIKKEGIESVMGGLPRPKMIT